LTATPALAAEAIELPPFSELSIVMPVVTLVFIVAIIGLLFGLWWYFSISREDPGSTGMVKVSQAVQEGAWAYLKKQMATMIWFVIIIFIALIFLYKDNPLYNVEGAAIPLYIGVAVAFVLGVAASYTAGLVGMMMAVKANCRVAHAALSSFRHALYVAFRAGSVSGMATVGLGLLGACIIFFIFGNQSMKVLVGFGFGGCLAALFMRIGGGIYTKAADVGADLVGKVEKNIPEDDPRNAATIADNVGDNVGDCAGMAADVFESYEVTLVAAIILGAAALHDLSMDPMRPISQGFWVAAILAIAGFFGVSWYVFHLQPITTVDGVHLEWWRFALANLVGVVLALVIERLTEYFTSTHRKPVTEAAKQARTGPATVILSGFASGMESSVWAITAIAVSMICSSLLFAGIPEMAAYGVALAGLGLLSTTGFMLAMDTYGPISDNAN